MCDIASLAIGGLAAASAASSYAGQAKAAQAEAGFQNEQYARTATLAKANYDQQVNQLGLRDQQELAASGQNAMQNQLAAMQAVSHANASAADAGAQGASVSQLLEDFRQAETFNNQTIMQNYQMGVQQRGQDRLSTQTEAQGRIVAVTPKPVVMPSAIGAALQIGAGVTNAYSLGMKDTRTPADLKDTWLFKKRF